MADIEKMTASAAAQEARKLLSDECVQTLILPLRNGAWQWEIWRVDRAYQRVWHLNSTGTWSPQDPKYVSTAWWQGRSYQTEAFVALGVADSDSAAHDAVRKFLTERLAQLASLQS